MQLTRVQRDVLAHRSRGAMCVFEAIEVGIMAVVFHAATETGYFADYFWYVLGGLICFTCFTGEVIRRQHCLVFLTS